MLLDDVDALDFIATAPPGATIYADPPYGSHDDYHGNTVDLAAMFDSLERHPGRVIVSGYQLRAGWRKAEIIPVRTRANRSAGHTKNDRRKEWLQWIN